MITLGVVSFLNARPLIEGLHATPGVQLVFDVPARLPTLLDGGAVDAALIPTIDVLRHPDRYTVVSDACIASDGETMTVRIFAQVPPDRVRSLWVDTDSHTSVALARVLWRALYDRDLELHALERDRGAAAAPALDHCEAVLLIGDKVVDPQRGRFAYEVDLGGAWRAHTGLPFVFALWAARSSEIRAANGDLLPPNSQLATRYSLLTDLLQAARNRGVVRAAEIAAEIGPTHGWPVELAHRYLTRCLQFRLDARAIDGVQRFARECAAAGIIPQAPTLTWLALAHLAEARQ
ncbi:MAG: menaquinone biosynthesis protein [Planctomycetota bacterium]